MLQALRRLYEAVSIPAVSLLDIAVLGSLYGVVAADIDGWIKATVLVPVLLVGGSSFVVRRRWWRPLPVCEVRNCTNRSRGQTVATNVDGAEVYRLVCHDHWMIWRGPGVGSAEAASMRDQMVEMWGWSGKAWARE